MRVAEIIGDKDYNDIHDLYEWMKTFDLDCMMTWQNTLNTEIFKVLMAGTTCLPGSSFSDSSVYSHSACVQQMAYWMFIVFSGKTKINSSSTDGECCMLPALTVWQQNFNLAFCCLLVTNRFWGSNQNGGIYIYLSTCTRCSHPRKINE